MSNPYRERLLSVGVISRRSRAIISEGRDHPQTRRAWKRTEDEGSIITEHNTSNDRVDATAKIEGPIREHIDDMRERKERADRAQQQ